MLAVVIMTLLGVIVGSAWLAIRDMREISGRQRHQSTLRYQRDTLTMGISH